MKNFQRSNLFFSLCGLNCGLCPMNLNQYCPGCGGGEGNQSCSIAKCSLQHGNVEYCSQCKNYPCEKYNNIDDFDSFITHRNQKSDLEKSKEIGIEKYNLEQEEKIRILDYLLSNYNDGRRKSFFCVAVNLLDISELKAALRLVSENKELSLLSKKQSASYVVDILNSIADKRGIKLKLNKKK